MAATLKSKGYTGIEIEVGRGGIFDVIWNGQTIYSKHEMGRFPKPAEILTKLPPA